MSRRPRLFEPALHGWHAARVGLLMVGGALTESVGIVLLVPLLAMLDQGPGGAFASWLAALGLPVRLGPVLALFVALVTLRALLTYARQVDGAALELALVNRLRARAWDALLHCEWRVAMGLNRGQATNVLITQVNQAGYAVNQALAGLATLVTLGGVALAALAISWRLALAGLCAGALVLLAYRGARQRAARMGAAMGETYDRVFARLDEGLQALRMIKSLGSEGLALRALTGEFAALEQAQVAYQRDLGRGRALLQVGGAGVLALLVWLAASRWHIATATLLPMVALFARSLPLLEALHQALLAWANQRPAIHSALALIGRAEAAREPDADGVPPPALARDIALDGVSVRFAGAAAPALAAVSLRLGAGEMIALGGPSGAGKSTLADLLGGLIAPDRGGVRIDGQMLDAPRRRAWRRRVAYVHQDPVLLNASLRANLRWAAPDADDARLLAALRDAAADFALDLPQGLDTPLGDGGRRLSGGERQRLMLARALLRDPALLILDEATSALDPANEALVARAIARLKGRLAIVVIGHHGKLAALADRRVRLAAGRIHPDRVPDPTGNPISAQFSPY